MTQFRSRPDGSHYPIQKQKSLGSLQAKTVHLNSSKKISYRYLTTVPEAAIFRTENGAKRKYERMMRLEKIKEFKTDGNGRMVETENEVFVADQFRKYPTMKKSVIGDKTYWIVSWWERKYKRETH